MCRCQRGFAEWKLIVADLLCPSCSSSPAQLCSSLLLVWNRGETALLVLFRGSSAWRLKRKHGRELSDSLTIPILRELCQVVPFLGLLKTFPFASVPIFHQKNVSLGVFYLNLSELWLKRKKRKETKKIKFQSFKTWWDQQGRVAVINLLMPV